MKQPQFYLAGSMTDEVTNVQKIRHLPWSIATNSVNSTFIQLTISGSVFVLFLSELGLGKGETGLLLSLLPFSGVLALFAAQHVARFGYKRTQITFTSARTVTAATLLLTPWVLSQYGDRAALWYVTAVVALFSILRAVGMTAYFPWIKEFVPDAVRGKYMAIDSTVSAVVNFAAILVATFVLERVAGLPGFMMLIGAGVVLGACGVATATRIPGGAPVAEDQSQRMTWSALREAFDDRNLRRYLAGLALNMLAIPAMFAFLPLFMREEVGLSAGNVVLLQAGTLVGGILTSYLWGWLADRFGSKPVALAGLALTLLLPLAWILMPRQSAWSLVVALCIAAVMGVANLGRSTGANNLFYVNIVSPQRKTEYMAIYYAWFGVFGGLGQMLAGWLLSRTQGLRSEWGIVHIDPYTPLFVAGAVFPLLAFFLFKSINTDDAVTPGQFVGMLVRGNPLIAMEGLIGFHLAKDEETAVAMTERLGQAASPLAADELVKALGDPRFWVRFEALLAIAHMQPDTQLRAAVVEVLNSGDPVLSVVAAWALGRMRDKGAVEPLRESMAATNQSVQAYSVRSLGILRDHTVIPVLLERLEHEENPNLQLAYVSALGQLRVKEATPQLLSLLRVSEDEIARLEISLALARMVGNEHAFIQLLRQAHNDVATAASQALLDLKREISTRPDGSADLIAAADECADVLGREQLEEGVALLCDLIDNLPQTQFDPDCCTILEGCLQGLDPFVPERIEYLVLALHILVQHPATAGNARKMPIIGM